MSGFSHPILGATTTGRRCRAVSGSPCADGLFLERADGARTIHNRSNMRPALYRTAQAGRRADLQRANTGGYGTHRRLKRRVLQHPTLANRTDPSTPLRSGEEGSNGGLPQLVCKDGNFRASSAATGGALLLLRPLARDLERESTFVVGSGRRSCAYLPKAGKTEC